jgi:siroheme decarboxylase
MSSVQQRLLNEFQRGFPLLSEPFRAIGDRLGVTESEVLNLLARSEAEGHLSRVGVVFRPNVVGASTLAALTVPQADLPRVAQIVSSFAEVNHNYEREHRYNLWFVVTARNAGRLQEVLSGIEAATGLEPLCLPLEREYHIDLGFDLNRSDAGERRVVTALPSIRRAAALDEDAELIAAIQEGFPLASRPFEAIGARAGLAEAEVIARLHHWLEHGVARRIGIVVRHHELGWRANAMVVWDVPDERVNSMGELIARQSFVTLCYRRPRRQPDWRYNLFCMIHGREPEAVLRHVETLRETCDAGGIAHQVLFSRRRFKQTGARYAA